MKNIKLTIIIPIYNVEMYIVECLESITNQSIDKNIFEIICIDDKGTDNSISKVNEFIANHEDYNINIISHEINKGLSASRNTGIRNANGEYLLLLDSDDYLIEGTLNKILDFVIDADVDIMEFGVLDKIETSEKIIPSITKITNVNSCSGDEYFFKKNMLHEYTPMSCVRIYKRTYLLSTELFCEGIHFEDEEFTPRIMLRAQSCACRAIPFYVYRRRADSITTSMKKSTKWIYDYVFIASKLRQLADENMESLSKDVLINSSSNLIISLFKNIVFYKLPKENKKIVSEIVAKDKLYRIPLSSNSIKIKAQGFLIKYPNLFMFVYKYIKRYIHE